MRITRRTVLGASAASAVSALALAACSQQSSGGGNGGGSGSDGGGNEAIASDQNDINPKDRGELGEGGTLRLMNNAYPANWNTAHTDGNESNTIDISQAISPGLYYYTAAGEVEVNEQMAKRIELVSEDPQVMEIELRDDMKWSDGTAIDYKSIENVFNTMNGSKPDYQIASSEGYDKVEKIEPGANNFTAKITFKEKYADWIGLASIMPDSLVASADAFNTGWVDAPQVTAGPYKIGKLDATNKTVSVVPDENWWGDKALLKEVIWTTIEDPAAAATSFQAGQLDSLETTVPATYDAVKGQIGNGISLRKAAGPRWTHITLNGTEGRALADQKVRQAVQFAINREDTFLAVNKSMPYPKDMEQLNNHVLMTNQEGYKDNAGDFGKMDADKAKKLLEEAGYTIGSDGMATKDGKPLEITYVYNDGSKTNEAVVPVVQQNLKDIGVTMNVQKVPPTDLFSKYVIPGQFDLTLFGWNGNPFLSSGDAIWKSDGEQNFGKVGSPEVDEIVAKAAVETDMDTRLDLINEYDAKLWELAGTIPLWQSYDFFVQTDDLANYGAAGFANIVDWTKVGYVKGSSKLG